jgi:hypothetical protein
LEVSVGTRVGGFRLRKHNNGGIRMKTDKYSLSITAYEYNVLMKNPLISTIFDKLMGSAHEHGDEVELAMTLSELNDFIGYVAAEANHAKTRKKGDDLNRICDYLETVEHTIKSDQKKRS